MLTWMKRLVAGGAMALAIGSTGVMVSSPAYAADDAKKPAVTAPAATPAAAEPAKDGAAPAAAPAAPAAEPAKK